MNIHELKINSDEANNGGDERGYISFRDGPGVGWKSRYHNDDWKMSDDCDFGRDFWTVCYNRYVQRFIVTTFTGYYYFLK